MGIEPECPHAQLAPVPTCTKHPFHAPSARWMQEWCTPFLYRSNNPPRPGLGLSCPGSWPGAPSTTKDRPVLEPSLCPPGLLSTLLSYPSSCFTDKEAQRGSLILPRSPSRSQLWLGARPGLETRSPDSPPGLSLSLQGDDRAHLPLGLGQSPPGRELAGRPLPVTLGLLDQQPGCCTGIQEHKRPHSRKGWGGSVGSPTPHSQR